MNKNLTQTPEEVTAAVLGKMKKIAEDYIEEEVKDAVITVPAYFNDAQRQATMDAGKIAGLNVKRIINEPTAAAMAYGLQEKATDGEAVRILVYDLGGGTFDASILEGEDDILQVKATRGNSDLGGEDFKTILIMHFQQEIISAHNWDVTLDHKAVRRLMNAREKLKINLSEVNTTESKIHLDAFLPDGRDFTYSVSRAKFESPCLMTP